MGNNHDRRTLCWGTFGTPFGLGVGLYLDDQGRAYPQLYGGRAGFGFSAGYTPNLEGLLTGPSIAGSPGVGPLRYNVGGNAEAIGVGVGTPGIGVTHGFGPLEASKDYSHPWITPAIRNSAMRAGVPSRYNVFEYGYPDSSAQTLNVDEPLSPFLRELQKYKRSEDIDDPPSIATQRVLSSPSTAPNFPDENDDSLADANRSDSVLDKGNRRYLGRRIAGQPPASVFDANAPATQPAPPSLTGRLPDIFNGTPMPQRTVPPSIWDFPNRSSGQNSSGEGRELQDSQGTGIPFLDEYIRYLNREYGT